MSIAFLLLKTYIDRYIICHNCDFGRKRHKLNHCISISYTDKPMCYFNRAIKCHFKADWWEKTNRILYLDTK